MNARERFQRTMHFQPVDRAPHIEVGCWAETRERWLQEGMPAGTGLEESVITFNGNDYFGLDRQIDLQLGIGMLPAFRQRVLSEDDQVRIVRGSDGVLKRVSKHTSAVPTYLAWPVQTREDFRAMARRYDALNPKRYPANWPALAASTHTADCPVWAPGIGAIGLYSMLRTWMGTEKACTVFYDDPALAEEMMEFIAEYSIALLERAFREARLDYYMWWEDFSFNGGPLVSPRILKRFMLPAYRRVNDWVRSQGVDIIFMDTDGDPRLVVPLLMEAGINVLYPLEQCNPQMHPKEFRKEYGRDLALWGGIDKRQLCYGRREIEAELLSKLPGLVEEGGYIPQIDHLAPPEMSYDNWLYYLEFKRKLLGGM